MRQTHPGAYTVSDGIEPMIVLFHRYGILHPVLPEVEFELLFGCGRFFGLHSDPTCEQGTMARALEPVATYRGRKG